LEQENAGLRESLGIKKKRDKHGKTMDLIQEDNHSRGAVMWSPRNFDQASERQSQREQREEQEKLRKTTLKELKASNILLNKKLQEERRIEKERLKKEREEEKEKKTQE
jgi:hypothetical protein